MNKSENTQTNRMEDGGLPPRQRHMVLGIMMAGTTAACISQSMMIAALPTIMQEFLVGAGLAQPHYHGLHFHTRVVFRHERLSRE